MVALTAVDNQVFLDRDSILHVIYVGDQDFDSVTETANKTEKLTRKLRNAERPVLALVDLSGMGKILASARLAAASTLRRLDYDRVAAFGSSKVNRQIGGLIVKAVGKSDAVKFFEGREDAFRWLAGDTVRSSRRRRRDEVSAKEDLEQYRAYVRQRIGELQNLLASASIGDLPEVVNLSEKDDEFQDVFVGVYVLIETAKERMAKVRRLHATELKKPTPED